MKMPLSEIIDRYTITMLKSERTNEDVNEELETYKKLSKKGVSFIFVTFANNEPHIEYLKKYNIEMPKTHVAKDVEDAVLAGEKGCVGLEIVQSGSTVKRKGLLLHGGPLFLSESLYVVDYDK